MVKKTPPKPTVPAAIKSGEGLVLGEGGELWSSVRPLGKGACGSCTMEPMRRAQRDGRHRADISRARYVCRRMLCKLPHMHDRCAADGSGASSTFSTSTTRTCRSGSA